MTEYSDAIESIVRGQRQQAGIRAVSSLDDDPEEASRAIELGQATGIPSSAIHGDVEGFERRHKAMLAQQILNDNPYLQEYINSHPLAAKVSNDDLANLDNVSQKVGFLNSGKSILEKTIEGFHEGFGEGGLGSWMRLQDIQRYRLLAATASVLGAPVEGIFRIGSGIMSGAVGGAAEAYHQLGGSEQDALKLKEDLGMMVAVALPEMAMTPKLPPMALKYVSKLGRIKITPRDVDDAAMYAKAGEVPPPGVNAAVDQIHKVQSDIDLENLDNALAESQKSATRERSPEFFKDFLRTHPEGSIQVSADAVRKLYGDKKPTPEDGLLGWVPNIVQQLDSASVLGGRIEIPSAEFLTHMDPSVFRELKDYIAKEDGLTKEEAKELGTKPAEAEEKADVLQSERKAAGLEPGLKAEEPPPEGKPAEGPSKPTPPEGEEKKPFTPQALGLSKVDLARYERIIARRNAEDEALQEKRLTAVEKKRRSEAWKQAEPEVRAKAEADVSRIPEVRADRFLQGQLFEPGAPHPALDEARIPDWVKEVLPKRYYREGGLDPDVVANLNGFSTGEDMLRNLGQYHKERLNSGKSRPEWEKFLVDQEVEQQFRQKFGLDKDIVAEIREHIISPTQFDLLHEETVRLGTMAGTEFTITKDAVKRMAASAFEKLQNPSIQTMVKWLKVSGRVGDRVQSALLKGDFAEAFRLRQQQMYAFAAAMEAKKLERELKGFNAIAKRMNKREPEGIPAEYTNWIHNILMRVGRLNPIRTVQDLKEAIALREEKTLQQFYEAKNNALQSMSVAEFLRNPDWSKPFKQLTVDEFRAVKESLDSMMHNAAMENKVIVGGDAFNLKETRGELIDAVKKFPEKIRRLPQTGKDRKSTTRTAFWANIGVEAIFDHWDKWDPKGAWNQYVLRPVAEGAGEFSRLAAIYSKKLLDVGDVKDKGKLIDNPIIKDPMSRTDPNDPTSATRPYKGFTNDNLQSMILHMGNGFGFEGKDLLKSNLGKLAMGYGVEPKALWDWVVQHSTKEMWDWAQKIGDIFEELKKRLDVVESNLSGTTVEKIRMEPFTITFPDGRTGTYRGWWNHVRYSDDFRGRSEKALGPNALANEFFQSVLGEKSWEKSRTSYTAPVDLTMNHLPNTLMQMIHEISLREAVANAHKILKGAELRNAVKAHYSPEVEAGFTPWLEALANRANYRSDAEATWEKTLGFFRQNIVSTAIGLRPTTVIKHGLTAGFLSMKQVGITPFAKAFVDTALPHALMVAMRATGVAPWFRAYMEFIGKDPETLERNWQWAVEKIDEVARRHQHYLETVYGANQELFRVKGAGVFQGKPQAFRSLLMRIGTAPVAFFDMMSTVPTAAARYRQAIEAGENEGNAVFMANKAVRQGHGTTAWEFRPAIMRGSALAQGFTSIYTFWSNMLQRRFEHWWQTAEMGNMVKAGDYAKAKEIFIQHVVPGVVVYYLLPAAVEEAVVSYFTHDKRGLGQKALWAMLGTIGGGFAGLRDLVYGAEPGHESQFGIYTSALRDVTKTVQSMQAGHAFDRQHFGSTVEHANSAVGMMTGLTWAQPGRTFKGLYNYSHGLEHPKGASDWFRLMVQGTIKEPKR